MLNELNLSIAGFAIKLLSDSQMELEDGYVPFVDTDSGCTSEVTVHCFAGIPTTPFANATLVFEAKSETQKFYSIYRSGTNLVFYIYNQQNIDEIQQVALLDETFTAWKVYSNPQQNGALLPLKYPLGPIIMHYLTVKSDAIMIHASCVFDGKKGRIFTGFSGNGKSTISKIWADAGNLIINDDRLIIRKQNNRFYAYNTPMYYKDIPKETVLDSIFLISHSPENIIKKLSGALAVSKVLAFCIQHNFDSSFIQNNLNLLSELSSQVAVYELGFVPDAQVVKFILENETTGTN